MTYSASKIELEENGYSILNEFYTAHEVEQMLECIEDVEQYGNGLLRTKNLFAIRQPIKNVPSLSVLLFNENLKALLSELFPTTCFLTKAIYFDKPSESNWFVPYHQDLSISVDRKTELKNYTNWTFKKGQYGVQPPVNILKNTVTIRVHLDQTDENNGALRVMPKSHLNGVIRLPSNQPWSNEENCPVKRGGLMLMKPLTLHASNRSSNGKQRRVIHLEFNCQELESPLDWLERHNVPKLN